MNHYEILGVSKTASFTEIKSSFRRKVKLVHPDLNPGIDKKEFILLNEAYEVLSDATTRSLYDLYLQGVPVKTEIETVTPQQRYRENYRRNRVHRERERMAAQIVYKQKFYEQLRYVNIGCFVLSLVLSFDYFESPKEQVFVPTDIQYEVRSTKVYLNEGKSVATSDDFYKDYVAMDDKSVVLTTSPYLSIPKRIKMKGKSKSYLVKGSIYLFGNAIGMLLFVFSIIVVANKKYSDPRLTFGVFSVVILIWTLAMILVYS